MRACSPVGVRMVILQKAKTAPRDGGEGEAEEDFIEAVARALLAKATADAEGCKWLQAYGVVIQEVRHVTS